MKKRKEIWVNKLTGIELNEIEKTINPKTRKSILIDKETGEQVKNFINNIDPEARKEKFIKIKPKIKDKIEVISVKDSKKNILIIKKRRRN